ncbi:MAG: Gfo/Idh/MocA family oxidoreductase [Nostocoides sp.]
MTSSPPLTVPLSPRLALPSPRTPDPGAAPPLRWGILAPGGIARSMAAALNAVTQQRISAVASRSLERAQAFATEFGVDAAYGSYAALVEDPSVDVVYVASPHSEHHEHALLALNAGKPVLVEKAFMRNASEARNVVSVARARGLFVMEAMWARFLPHYDVIRQCVEGGLLGSVETVFADHGQPLYPGGPQRLADPALAGGALLDLGIYPLSFASMVLGGLTSAMAVGDLTAVGVDGQEAMTVRGAGGGLGVLHATMLARTATTASVIGTAGRLDVDGPFYGAGTVRFTARDGSTAPAFEPATREHGLAHEAAEVARCITEGRTESELMPLDETVAIMATMDSIRQQLGVVYPGETS